MSGFTIGDNALRTALQRMDVAGHNIANIHTPGYHSRKANLTPVHGGGSATQFEGMGVEVSDISRMKDILIDEGLLRHKQEAGYLNQLERVLRHVETMINEPSEFGLNERFSDLFATLERWAGEPDDPTLQQSVINKAASITDMLNHMDRELQMLEDNLISAAEDTTTEINRLTGRIADLNHEIKTTVSAGRSAASLEDERDQMVHDLAELVDFNTHETNEGVKSINCGGIMLVSDVSASELSVREDEQGLRIMAGKNTKNEIQISGGQLAGISTAHQEVVSEFRGMLDELANSLRRQMNNNHSTGLVQSGRFTELEGSTNFIRETPVHEMGYDVPSSEEEQLIINVEDDSGDITDHSININTTLSAEELLDDIIDQINEIDSLTAVDNEGRLRIESNEPDHAFGFATPYNPRPDRELDADPEIMGSFNGEQDLRYRITFLDSGRIGEDTIRVRVEVEDMDGHEVKDPFTRTVDESYEPGTAINLEQGLELGLEGEFVDGEAVVGAGNAHSFEFTAYSKMDSAGILDALGMNTFLDGLGASGIGVAERVANEPSMFATSKQPESGDNRNLLRMADLSQQKTVAGETATFQQYYSNLVTDAGSMHQNVRNTLESEKDLVKELENQRDSVIGVNMEEQLIEIMQSKSLYQGAMRYITLVDQYYEELSALI